MELTLPGAALGSLPANSVRAPTSTGVLGASTPGHAPWVTTSVPGVGAASPGPAGGGGVNLSHGFTHEPAPMGVAYYGVDAAGTPSVVATPVLLGIATLSPTITWNGSLVSPWSMNFELGGNLKFTVGGTTYVYWIQDVLQYSTKGGNAAFFDRVWNASGAGAQMRAGTIAGAGTLITSGAGEYYDCPANSSLPGNGYFIPLPAEIEVEMTAVHVAAAPGVSLAFNDGFGWLTFDTLSFPFAAGANDSGFVIDGSAYRPDGKFLDAEFAVGGPAVGSQTRANSSNLQLELQYWNGHNLQEAATAYNFASDSSETISNVLAAPLPRPSNGTLLANVTAGSGGTLRDLWNRSDVGELNVSTSIPNGELFLNGRLEGGFTGGAANLTLAPGNYTLAIYNQSLLEGQTTTTVAAGSYQFLRVAWQDVYAVTFQEAGLPPSTPWSVVVDNVSLSAGADAIPCELPNGAHPYRVAPLAGFAAFPSSGTLTITGANVTLAISWTVQTYQLTFVPRGLPANTRWTVTVNGMPPSSSQGNISFAEPSGTYSYAIAPVPGFRPSPVVGSVQVPDRNQTINITWTPYSYPIVFAASGLPVGRAWSLAVQSAGVWLNSSQTSAVVSLALANGSFDYVVGAPAGFETATPTGHNIVNGTGFTVPLVFRGANGFLAGTVRPASSSLWVDNVSVPLANGSFNVSVTPGPHDVRASAPGYDAVEMVLVVLSNRVTPVDWNLSATPATAGASIYLPYAVVGVIAVAALGIVVWFRRRPLRPRAVEAEVIDEHPTG